MNQNQIEDIYPLSPMQQGLLFHTLYSPSSGMYVIQSCHELKARIDERRLARACELAVGRHSTLRTSFAWEGLDEPVQVVHGGARIPLTSEDWRGLGEAEREERLESFLSEDRVRGFDLGGAPLVRLALFRTGESSSYLVLSCHHVLLDGWSVALLGRELLNTYEALGGGQSPAARPARQYRDYIAWLQRQDAAEAESYWREALRGFTSPTPLGDGRQEGPAGGHGELSLALTAAATAALEACARQNQLTLSTIVQGAWAVLLSRYSGSEDVLFGVTTAGRPPELEGVEEIIGLFINTLPLRVSVGGEEPLLQWLKGLQARQAEMRQYEYSPLVQIQKWSEVRPGLPLFESIIAFANYPAGQGARQRGEGAGRVVQVNSYPLALVVSPGEEMRLQLVYDRGRFAPEEARRVLRHLSALLEGIGARPAQSLSELSPLTADERRDYLFEWNRTSADYPREACIHWLFEEQARKTPDRAAVDFRGRRLTYGELNALSDRLADRLRSLGVGPGERVGLCLEHSPETLVAILGTLKAGAAYVPLDPGHPKARLAFVLEDASVRVLLTQGSLAALLPETSAEVICLDAGWEREGGARRPEETAVAATAEDVAYLIYTSGSTGKPKGVKIRHRSLVNYVSWAAGVYLRGESLDFPLYSSLAFDLTVTSVFTPLVTGGKVVVYRDDGGNGLAILDVMRDDRVGVLKLTPSHLSVIKGLDNSRSGIRRLIVGGEVLDADLAMEVHRSFGGRVEIFNEYGPTEATIGCMIHRYDPARDTRRVAPIGVPAANTQIYLLDAGLEPVAENVVGEIYISGDGLAEGYHNRDDLTRERFVENPFAPGKRMYRTGDIGRRLPGGGLEMLGRRDDQVKFHGHRVELGEIRSHLNRHPQVRDSVIVVTKDRGGEDVMLAYYVSRQELEAGALRGWLSEHILKETVPNLFVHLKKLPLTLNGKIDHRALPTLEEVRRSREQSFETPRTLSEEAVASAWAEVLGLDKVGAQDNFFELGGHSLLATQVSSRLKSALGVELPLRSLFEHPTVETLAREAERLMREGHGVQSPPITPSGRDNQLPLSFAQQRLWFISQLEPESALYNIPVAVKLEGPLDVGALARALSEVIRRHEVLRSAFPSVDGRAVQLVHEAEPFRLPIEDLSALGEAQRESGVRCVAEEEATRPFNLSAGPLVRARLLRLSEEEHVLVVVMHHIVSDGWSMGLLVKEVSALYEAYTEGRESPLSELPIQYADYALWQRDWLQGEVLERQLSYWRSRLEGAPTLELPTDRPRPARQSYRCATVDFALGAELSEGLRELSRREGATLFMTLLAAFQLLLSRYSGQKDFVIGADVAGRNRAEVEGLIGFFVNMLVLRTPLTGDETFSELVGRVREVCLQAYAHQDVPFDLLVKELQPERELSRSPLFQVIFVLHNVPMGAVNVSGLKLTPLPGEGATTQYDLVLHAQDNGAGITLTMEYSLDLFEKSSVLRLLEHFQTLLEGAVACADGRAFDLPLLAEAERRRITEVWGHSAVYNRQEKCVHELFEEQAALTPQAVALEYAGQRLSYEGLNARANQLAHHLRGLGVGPEVRVGVLINPSAEMVVSLLAVLKAGGAYVPLDPEYPIERLAFMIEDAQVSVLLTDEGRLDKLPAYLGQVISVDGDRELIDAQSESDPGVGMTADNLAYVMYTSGSTGLPKGVAVLHRAITRLVCDPDYVRVEASDVVAQASNVLFDAATFEIWGALLNGARLAGIDKEVVLSPKEFAAQLREREVSVVFLTTALFNQMAGETPCAFSTLRHVLFGGEFVDPQSVRRVLSECGPRRLLHVYGPTESTTFATWHLIEGVADEATTVPIGGPIANTTAYVLDAGMSPLPPGVLGELYLGGDGLARGYLNQPELTAEKFVPDPFSEEPGARLYRTGDLVRWSPEGELEFVGRADHQVKVRGHRIELGEIESRLRSHPAVAESIVIVKGERGDKRLVAYVVATRAGAVDAAGLREHLGQVLPNYMIPSSFVTLDALPLTPNGKVDRKALPEPDAAQAASEFSAPCTPAEEIVASAWAEVLGVEKVGRQDNFFELGGHSLLATQAVSRLRSALGVELPLRSLFERPTVEGLAREAERLMSEGFGVEAPPIVPAGRDRELPLSFAQQRLWFIDQLEPGGSTYNMPVAVRLEGRLDVDALRRSLSEVIRRHEVLRTTFPSVEGRPAQLISEGRPFDLPVEDLSPLGPHLGGAEAERLAGEEATRPFNLSAGPLVRARLLRLSEEEHVLVVVMHHIVSDGWSMGLLVKEVSALYEAYTEGRESPLSELPIQYADYALWQREWLQGEVLEKQLSYWRSRLEGAPTLELPTDGPRPASPSHSGASVEFALAPELSAGLRRLSRAEGATLFMTLLAAFQLLLSRYSGQEDVTVGTPVAGRGREETEGLIGFFVNTLVLRADLSGGQTFLELLSGVRETCLGAYAHQDVPFERLVEELKPGRDLGRNPLFQVMFALQNAPEAEAGPSGLLISPVRAETRTSILDLFLSARDSDQGIGLIMDYNTDLFSEAWAKELLQGFAALLQAISERPAATVKELHELLTETARRQKNLRLQELKRTRSQMLEGVRARSAKRSEPLAV